MTSNQKFMAKALLILAGSCVAVQGQTANSMKDSQTEKAASAGNATKQDRDQRKLARARKQAQQRTKNRDTNQTEAPSNTPIEYGG